MNALLISAIYLFGLAQKPIEVKYDLIEATRIAINFKEWESWTTVESSILTNTCHHPIFVTLHKNELKVSNPECMK